MTTSNQVSCPVCGGETTKVTNHSPSSYWRCRACGTSHLHPKPTPEFVASFYEQFHKPDVAGGIFEKFEDRTATDFPAKASHVVRTLRTQANGSLKVLDVGCGKGFFVRELQYSGVEAEGIDLSATAVEAGRQQSITGLHSGHVEECAAWVGVFHAATCWATIEHLLEPVTFLEGIRRVLRPGGILFLDTGVGNDAVDRHAPGFVQWYDPPQHIFVFSPVGMRRLLREAGFEVLSLDTNFERSAARRIVKLTRNLSLSVLSGLLFRAMLGRATFQQMKQEAKMPFGSLMLVVARAKSA